MVDSGDGDTTADRNRETDTTLHLNREFEAQLAALDGEVSPEVQEAIAALPSGSALLVVRRGPNTGARFLLDSDVTTAGRHPDADIFLDDVTVSRRHSRVRPPRERLRDQGPRLAERHLFRRRTRSTQRSLSDGAEVQIGKFRLTFYASRLDLARLPGK